MHPGGAAFRAGKADGKHLEEDEEAGDLGAGGDERRAGCGRALVDVRRPEMERRGGDLEAEADRRGDDGDQQQRIQRRTGGRVDRGGNARQAGGVRQAVEQAEAEEQKGRRHSAEEEIFQRGFRGSRALLVERGEDVEREAQQFQRDENHQQILGADEEHHADGREQDEQNEFADVVGEARVVEISRVKIVSASSAIWTRCVSGLATSSAVEDIRLRAAQRTMRAMATAQPSDPRSARDA